MICFFLAIALLLAFILYESGQPSSQRATITGPVTPVPAAPEVVFAQPHPLLLMSTLTDKLAGRYYVINDARLYCSFITSDLQYSGEPAMQAWWDSLQPAMKQWYFNDCQR